MLRNIVSLIVGMSLAIAELMTIFTKLDDTEFYALIVYASFYITYIVDITLKFIITDYIHMYKSSDEKHLKMHDTACSICEKILKLCPVTRAVLGATYLSGFIMFVISEQPHITLYGVQFMVMTVLGVMSMFIFPVKSLRASVVEYRDSLNMQLRKRE